MGGNSAEYKRIMAIVQKMEQGVKYPPVILGYKYDNGYELRDGKHRLSAKRYLEINIVEAFVRIDA